MEFLRFMGFLLDLLDKCIYPSCHTLLVLSIKILKKIIHFN